MVPILLYSSLIFNSSHFTFPLSLTPLSTTDFLVRLMEELDSVSIDQDQEDQDLDQEEVETETTRVLDSSDENY